MVDLPERATPVGHQAKLKTTGYRFHLFFVWVPSADVSIDRVAKRVILGGHGIPEDTIRRRYQRGIENFFRLYQTLTDGWEFHDNDNPWEPRLIAMGNGTIELAEDEGLWTKIKAQVKS